MSKEADVIIVGAGPAGAATAIKLAEKGISSILIDKARFPRDKICGDGLTPDVGKQLRVHFPDVFTEFLNQVKYITKGISVNFDAKNEAKIVFNDNNDEEIYSMPREVFDQLFFEYASKQNLISIHQGQALKTIEKHENAWKVITKSESFTGRYVVGADGAQSKTYRLLSDGEISKKHHLAALRQYYTGIKDLSDKRGLEFYLLEDILPGYFWVFPLGDGRANVGLGMRSDYVSKKKVDLKAVLEKAVKTHPKLKDRFAEAEPLENPKGFGLPVGSKKRKIAGEGFVLVGDAAGLIDPTTGEGIGNALRSARFAADSIESAMADNSTEMGHYSKRIFDSMGTEFKISYMLQRMTAKPWIVNGIFRRILQNKRFQGLYVDGFDLDVFRKKMNNPLFVASLVLRK